MVPSCRLALLASVVAAPLLAGCAPMFEVSGGHDPQACVEDALRRGTSRELGARAAAEFDLGCRAGEAAACSAAGVTAELGIGRPKNEKLAASLYATACNDGNQRACVNLADLQLRRDPKSDLVPRRMLEQACDAGDRRGCARLGKLLVGRPEGAADERAGRELLERACLSGGTDACGALGDLEAKKSPAGARSQVAIEYWVRACVAGDALACQRLSPPRERVASR